MIGVAALGGHARHALLRAGALTFLFGVGGSTNAHAQAFISPSISYDFGRDTGCVNVLLCADRNVAFGVAGGVVGRTFGYEEEFVYARSFFGSAPNLSSSVLTAMTNLTVSRHIGRWHPYAVGGLGLLITHMQFTQSSLFTTDRKKAAWDVGGGVTTYFSRRLGVDVDVRYLRALQEVRLEGFSVGDSKLRFGRVGAALVLRF